MFWGRKMMKRILLMILLGTVLLISVFLAVRPAMCSSTSPSADILLGAGAKWAANGGSKVAYVDDYDNLIAYPNPFGSNDYFLRLKNAVLSILQGENFTVDTFATIPANLSQYSLLYLEAYWACDPTDEPVISNYISNGGGVVLKSGVICYLVYYSKNLNTGTDLSSVASWFGANQYINTGGAAYMNIANPLNTPLKKAGDQLCTGEGYSNAAITFMNPDSQVLATWEDGSTFAFMHTYGQGRVYWQARQVADPETASTPPVRFSEPSSLTVYGSFDYGVTEQANVKIFAELRDLSTLEPISGANVTIQVFDPNDTLWVSAVMVETSMGAGIYEWQSNDTVANMNLAVGVYLARVEISNGGLSTSEIMVFHVDPPSSTRITTSPSTVAETATFQFYLTTIIAVALCATLVTALLLRKTERTPVASASSQSQS
jgi:hypothetical protein